MSPWISLAMLIATVLLGVLPLAAQNPATSSLAAPAAHKPLHPAKRSRAAHPAAPPAQAAAPVQPVAPKPPDWPANDHPAKASVIYDSQGLRIEAANSSLDEILKEVSTVTGARIVGFSSDERVFGAYGPGKARDVLSQLLEGSGYNLLIIGDKGQGEPLQIQLSTRHAEAQTPSVSNQANNGDEDADVEEQPQQPAPVPAMRSGFGPGAPPRTPQQIMQELQQRQEQMQQRSNPQF
jgi:hypothetical protein